MVNELSAIANVINAISKDHKDGGEDLENSYDLLKQMYSGPNSISKKSKQGIYEYPFLISSSVSSMDSICKIMKHIEVEYSNMLLISMGLNPSINDNENISIKKYLSNFHTNGSDYSMSVENTYDRGINELTVNDLTTEAAPGPVAPNTIAANVSKGLVTDPSKLTGTFTSRDIGKRYSDMFNMTIINITLRLKDDKSTEFSIPIGIRSIPHHLPAPDLLYVMESFIKSRVSSGLVRFIQWRSGEIKGISNLIFRFDEIKNDTEYEKRIGTNNSWLSVLKSRNNNRRFHILSDAVGKTFNKNVRTSDILPNCTFVINFADVDEIEDKTGVNLFTDANAARKYLDDSMGLCLCILDDGLNVAHIMYSGDTKFTAIPLSSMGKSDSNQDYAKVFLDIMKRQ